MKQLRKPAKAESISCRKNMHTKPHHFIGRLQHRYIAIPTVKANIYMHSICIIYIKLNICSIIKVLFLLMWIEVFPSPI